MSHGQKITILQTDLRRRGISPYTVSPILYRVCWRAGIHIPPPLYAPGLHGLICAFLFLLLGLANYILAMLAGSKINLWLGVMLMTVPAIIFGTIMGLYYWKKAKSLGLGRWSEFGECPVGPSKQSNAT